MSKPVIEVSGLSKCYRLHSGRGLDQTLPEAVSQWTRSLLRREPRATTTHDNEHWALREVSFSVQPGQALGIIGRNGAGKSTLMKILSRITHPTHGKAVLRGRVASLLEVGTGFHPELTGRENVYLNGTILGLTCSEIRRSFDAIVDFAGVEKFIDTPIKHYSSGMTVRLAFAVAAHLEPEIMIVDEVLAVGDAAFQKKCIGKMQEVSSNQGRTVLFVSHNLAVIQQLCRRSIVMQQGRLIAEGPSSEMVGLYLQQASANMAGQAMDLTTQPRTGIMGRDAKLTQWSLLDAAGHPVRQLRFGEPLTIDVRIESHANVGSAVVECFVQTPEGTLLAAISNEQWNQDFSLRHGGRYHAQVRVDDLRLMPGAYHLGIRLRSGHAPLDHLPSVGMIEVTPELYKAQTVPGSQRSLVHVQPQWNWHADRASPPLRQAA